MAIADTMTGARAMVNIGDRTVGIFSNVSWDFPIDVQTINILGRYDAVENVITGLEPIRVTCTGWRVVGRGPHDPLGAKVPKLQDLLFNEDITLSIYDRQDSSRPILVVTGCRSAGYSGGLSAKSAAELTVTYIGLVAQDESGPQSDPGGVQFP